MQRLNAAGRLAAYFLTSKLTPAIVVAIAAWGMMAIFFTPRQENPQITMPAATIVTQYPGASSAEVQRLVTERGERVLQEIPGIEHVYGMSNQNVSILTVLFHVGDDPTKSFVDLYDQVFAHLGDLPPGASQPQIMPLSVDDIPIVVLTLHGQNYSRGQLDAAGERLIGALRAIPGISTIDTYGGLPRQVNVTIDPVRLGAYGLSPGAIAQALGATNLTQPVGSLRNATNELTIHAGTAFASADQVGAQIVGVSKGQPVNLRSVATVELGYRDEEDRTQFADGSAAAGGATPPVPAVNLAIAKKAGTNAVDIAERIQATIAAAELPPGVSVSVTRNYGEKANDAVNELIQRLIEAIAIVVVLLLVLGWREALVVATAIPLTLFVTLGIGMLTGQSINRITLFALILGLGLLVDQAIVIVENIHRHYGMDPTASKAEATVRAVNEIGSPTTLATLTVVLSFLPMLFVTGMMGPYMRPIPINVPISMVASLLIAFAITPWATYALLRNQKAKAAHGVAPWIRPFRTALAALLAHPRRGSWFLGALLVAFLASAALPVVMLVQFRMLPDSNETTFLVSIDAPAASPVDVTTRIADAVGAELARTPEVDNYQTFVGTNAVPDLTSLLQGTVFRNAPNLADIRVNLVPKGKRHVQSADLVRQLRPTLGAIAKRYGATLRILQTPPGPPVRDTIVAKIYGPDPEVRRAIASRVVDMMQRERGVVDIDSSYKELPVGLQLEVDQRKASLSGVSTTDIAQTLGMSLHGATVSTLHTASDARPLGIFVRFAPDYRRDAAALASIQIPSRSGALVPLSAVTTVVASQIQQPLYRDDFEDVAYVGADMAGRSSTYAVIDMLLDLSHNPIPSGYRVDWDGEWHLTNTVFADLGRAMLIAFILIYFVLVARFRSFTVPLVVLAAVPLAVIGVMPGFALLAPFGVYFSATAMIGLIALIGIVVRNSIILIEFIEDKIKEGGSLDDSLVEATAARTRPIFLTAAAGVLSSVVIASDPVWSGLAWALVFGMTASAVLSVLAIPLLYERVARKSLFAEVAARGRTAAAVTAIALAAIVGLGSPLAAGAATPSQASPVAPDFSTPVHDAPLSLDAAIAIAQLRNPGYQSVRVGVDLAASQIRQARSAFGPMVQLRDNLLYADPVAKLDTPFGPLPFATTTTTNVPLLAIQYQIFDGGLNAARFSQATAGLAAAEATERQARAALTDATTKAYFDLVAATRMAEVASRSVAVARDHQKQAEQLFAAGQVAHADVLRAQTEVANENVGAIVAGSAVSLAQTNLANTLGVPLQSTFAPTEKLEIGVPAFNLDALLASAHAQRGDLAAARAAVTAAARAVDQARAGNAPTVGVFVSDGNTQPAVVPGYHNQVSAGLSLVWTLFDNGYTAARVTAAKAGVRQAELGVEQLESGIAFQVRQAYLAVNDAAARVTATEQFVRLADENLRLAQVRYRGGVGTALELQDAELRANAARQELVGAQIALRQGIGHLRFAAGLLD